MNKIRSVIYPLIYAACDLAAISGSMVAAVSLRRFFNFITGIPHFNHSLLYYFSQWWIPAVVLSMMAIRNVYSRRMPVYDEMRHSWNSLTTSFIVILGIISLGKFSDEISRLVMFFLWAFSLLLIPVLRIIMRKLLFRMGFGREKILIIGAGRAGEAVVKEVMYEKNLGYEIAGFLDDKKKGGVSVYGKEYPVIGKVKNHRAIAEKLGIRSIVLAIPTLETSRLAKLTAEIQSYALRVLLVPELKGVALLNSELYHLFREEMFLIKIRNNLESVTSRFLKRSSDIVLSLMIIPLLIPLVAILSVLVKIDSRGPVFFRQKRVGRREKLFHCFKFRSMHVNGDEILKRHLAADKKARQEWKQFNKLKDDPRITRIGRLLRKTSLDELPQIFNVLAGEMSLVGPRPYIARETEKYPEAEQVIYLTRPGITGLWQVSGRNRLPFSQRVALDRWYVVNWSLTLDLYILIKTVKAVLTRDGAY